ncbi:MIC25 protein, partial [Dicaeum eximium]|nr:MIC25 protein [Dicaeum eximium]
MGGSESSHGGRRVSFGLDEREQVRVLQGIRLTEDVVKRMKGSSPSRRDIQRSPRAANGSAPSSLAAGGKPRPPGTVGCCCHCLFQRVLAVFWAASLYLEEQALVQEELLRLAKREREAASAAKERSSFIEERQKAAHVVSNKTSCCAVELQGREAELKRQEDFYKEQLARIERK